MIKSYITTQSKENSEEVEVDEEEEAEEDPDPDLEEKRPLLAANTTVATNQVAADQLKRLTVSTLANIQMENPIRNFTSTTFQRTISTLPDIILRYT